MLISMSGKKGSGKNAVSRIILWLICCHKHPSAMEGSDVKEWVDRKLEDVIYDLCKWEEKAFAYKVKQVASILTGIPIEKFEDQKFKEQLMGEEWWYWKVQGRIDGKIIVADKIFTDKHSAYKYFEQDGSFYAIQPLLIKPTVRNFLQRLGTEAIRDHVHPNAWVNALFADYEEIIEMPKNWSVTDNRFLNESKAIKDRGGIIIRVNRDTGIKDDHYSETALDDYNDFDYVIDNNGSLEELVQKVKEILIDLKLI